MRGGPYRRYRGVSSVLTSAQAEACVICVSNRLIRSLLTVGTGELKGHDCQKAARTS